MRNHSYGLDIEKEILEQSDTDWVFGGSSTPGLAYIPEDKREEYLPQGEVQRGKEDMQDCATRAPINKLETDLNFLIAHDQITPENKQFLIDNGFVTERGVELSDAYNAILSGTTPSGNSLKAPIHSIHEYGFVPKALMPLDPDMTWDDYHDRRRMTTSIKKLGKEITKRFRINYTKVYSRDFAAVLPSDSLVTAGYAWPQIQGGRYGAVDFTPNHAFLSYKRETFAFDNYEEETGDFIKHLRPDYKFFEYGYRVYFSQENPKPDELCKRIITFLKTLL